MLQAKVRIDGRDYSLPSGVDVDTIMEEITEQVRAGGGFVELVRTSDRVIHALVSPGVRLTIEITDVEEQRESDGEGIDPDPLARTWLDVLDVL